MKKHKRSVEDTIKALEHSIKKFGDFDGKRVKLLKKLLSRTKAERTGGS